MSEIQETTQAAAAAPELTPQQVTEKLLKEKPTDVKELESALHSLSAQQEALKRCTIQGQDIEAMSSLLKHLTDTKAQLLDKYLSNSWVTQARAAVEAAAAKRN
jgi:hypothetical protein